MRSKKEKEKSKQLSRRRSVRETKKSPNGREGSISGERNFKRLCTARKWKMRDKEILD